MRNNAMWNARNPHQGEMTKVLCVCSAGLLRSPTLAFILSNHGYNTRAAGIHDYALIQVDEVLNHWADIVICAEDGHARIYKEQFNRTPEYVLNIPDSYNFRDPRLVEICTQILRERGLIQ